MIPARMRPALACGAALLASAVFGALPHAQSQDRNFAGSLQASYMSVIDDEWNANNDALDGFVTEVSAKLAVDFGEHVSANVKACYGCHGFEMDMAYVDLTVVDELRFRVGRFNPSFGEFPLRHDPANHRTVDKPLPYDMGRMLRMTDWNQGVLPSPYVDNGLEMGGTHWFGYTAQLDYAVYAVGGLRGDNEGLDLDFRQSRASVFQAIDNNSRPAAGGRIALTLDFTDQDVAFTLGASGMYGTYDPDNKLSYALGGADFYLRVHRVELRAEYLLRYNQMGLGDDPSERFKYGPGQDGTYDDYFLKEGFYVELTAPATSWLEVVARGDGLRRRGNVAVDSTLRKRSAVLRYTAGFNFLLGWGARLKLMGEYYDFSDFHDEIALTLGLVAVL